MAIKKHTPFIILGFLAAALALAFLQFRLPEPAPVDAAADQFSSGRALELLAPLAAEPHPSGSPQLAAVGASLVDQLESLGLQVERQSATGTLPRYNAAGHADNILASLPGSQPGGALLLIAHYDSVPQAPGAGDNGSGVVTILETLRALQTELPLENDILVLFTDAEEYGTLGAQAFTGLHPWMQEVSVALNIEGTLKGSVVLVETGPQNGWFVQNFRSASPHAMGYSWLYDLFGLMPNLTDFMPFREAGVSGGNLFSFNGGSQYHTPRDTIENMDERSLQQHGEQTLALVRHFGRVDLSQPQAPNVIYFNLWKGLMVIYPSSWALPLAGIASLLILAALWLSVRRRQMRVKQMLLACLSALLGLAAGPVLVTLVWGLICMIHPQYNLYYPAHTYNDGWYAAAFTTLALAVTLGLGNLWHRKFNWRELLGGALVVIGILNVTVSLLAPGFSYLFTWPLVFAVLPLWVRVPDRLKLHPGFSAVLGLLAAPSILLWLPLGAILYWSSGLDFLPAIALAAVLPLLLWSPVLDILPRTRSWLAPAVLAAAAFIGIIGGSLTSGFDEARPLPLRVQYFLNANTNEAFWLNSPGPLSEWQTQFTAKGAEEVSWKEIFPPFRSNILASPAEAAALEAPSVTILEDFIEVDVQHLRLQITPTRQSDQLILAVPPGAILISANVEGRPWMEISSGNPEPLTDWLTFFYAAPPSDGIEIKLEVLRPGIDQLLVAERSVGLEGLPGLAVQPRPADIISLGDYVYVSRAVSLITGEGSN